MATPATSNHIAQAAFHATRTQTGLLGKLSKLWFGKRQLVQTPLGWRHAAWQQPRAPLNLPSTTPLNLALRTHTQPKNPSLSLADKMPVAGITASSHASLITSHSSQDQPDATLSLADKVRAAGIAASPHGASALQSTPETITNTEDSTPKSVLSQALQVGDPEGAIPDNIRQALNALRNALTYDAQGIPSVTLSGDALLPLLIPRHANLLPYQQKVNAGSTLKTLLQKQQSTDEKLTKLKVSLKPIYQRIVLLANLSGTQAELLQLKPIDTDELTDELKVIWLSRLLNQKENNGSNPEILESQRATKIYYICKLLEITSLNELHVPEEELKDISQLTAHKNELSDERQKNALQIAYPLAQGMQALHQNGWVHGAICTHNIQVGKQSELYGNCALANTNIGVSKQPRESVAPEALEEYRKWSSNPRAYSGFEPPVLPYTRKMDVYALGVALGMLIGAISPSIASNDSGTNFNTAQSARSTIVSDRGVLARKTNKTPLEQLFLDMTEKDPGQRPNAETIVHRLKKMSPQ